MASLANHFPGGEHLLDCFAFPGCGKEPAAIPVRRDFAMVRSRRSQVAFAESSLRDRIPFAHDPRRNRTAFVLSGENALNLSLLRLAGCFLRSGLQT